MLLKQMEATIHEFSLLDPHDDIIVGVSGGPDSLALLDGLDRLSGKYGWHLTAVHVHHQLRGREADEDAEYVKDFCLDRGIAYELCQVDVRGYLNKHGGNLQEVARQLRYKAFRGVADKVGARKLALGHHADDQAETVLMRFLRGAGASGLVGIPVKRDWRGIRIVRPLWRTWRQEIEMYCNRRELTPRLDSSNASTDYMRNRIRLELIPQLQQYNPQLRNGMLQLSEQLAAEEEMWKEWTKQALERVLIKRDEKEWHLSVPAFRKLSLALQRRVIQLILNYLAIHSWTHTESVRLLTLQTSPSARCSLPGNWEAVRDYDIIVFCEKEPAKIPESYHIQLNVPGVTKLPTPNEATFEAVVTHDVLETDKWGMRCAVFDAAKVTGQLYVRTRRQGDRIHMIGMDGHKKVKNLFIDEKIPRRKRDTWPCVTDESDILWIPGLRRSTKALVSDETRQRIYVFYHIT